jgi:hypothetical protein
MMSGRRTIACACLLALGVAACSGGGGSGNGAGAQPRSGKLTSAEMRYGLAPDAHPNVTYQSDVVVVGGGAASVVSASADGATWTIAANAPHVDDLAVGKVMTLTDQSTGRILSLHKTSHGVEVKLLPVQLGEVFKNANLSIHVPLSSNDIGFDPVAEPGGNVATVPPGSAAAALTPDGDTPASSSPTPATNTRATMPAPAHTTSAPPKHATLMAAPGGLSGGFFGEAFGSYPGATGFAQDSQCGTGSGSNTPKPKSVVTPFVNTNGPTFSPAVSVKAGNWDFELERLPGQLTFRGAYVVAGIKIGVVFRIFGNLSLSGTDTIKNGKETASGIHLDGVNRMTVGFLGGAGSSSDNLRARIDIPLNLEILTRQLYVEGIPMVVSAKPKIIVETAFSASNSTLWTCGDYNMQLGAAGAAGAPVAKSFHANRSLLPINGLSIGVNGIVIALETRFQAGIGLKAAYAGPFATLDIAVGATRGSDIGIVNCQGADLVISGKAGVGLSLDLGFASSIMGDSGKQFLSGNVKRALGLQRIANSLRGIQQKLGTGKGDSIDLDHALYAGTIYKAHKVIPNSPICQGSS